jgi:hypothetical protein
MDANDLLSKLRTGVGAVQPESTVDPQKLLLMLDAWERDAREKDRQAHAQRVQVDLEERVEKIERAALLDIHTKLVASTFDKGSAYTNVIMVGGYAAFFGLWSLVKDLGSPMNRWSVLAILASVTLFVVFEFAKMSFLGRQSLQRYKLYNTQAKGMTFEQLKEAGAALDVDLAAQSNNFMVFWIAVVPLSAILGFIGVALLASDLFRVILLSGA